MPDQTKLDSACKCKNKCSQLTRCDHTGIDTPCTGINRCNNPHPVSWDAYAFRPPLPSLNTTLLNPGVYMNMAQAENRAGAALVVANVAGGLRGPGPPQVVIMLVLV